MTSIPLKPDNTLFTDSQWRAIYDGNKNLLVSASAGSGKTTVLVERVIEKIKAGVNVDELLVVTFTNAAAKEMKSRIQEAIQDAINRETSPEERRHLIAQVPLLPHANISTIHSFCLQIIRRYYYLIDLDPVFRPLTDDTEQTLLKEDAWDKVREELYGQNSELFDRLAETFSNDRSDKGFTDLIFSLYAFAQAHPQPTEWLNHLSDLYRVTEDTFTASDLYKNMLRPTLLQITETLMELTDSGMSIGGGAPEVQKQTEQLQTEKSYYAALDEAIRHEQIQQVYEMVQSHTFKTWGTPRKGSANEDAIPLSNEMKRFRATAKDLYTEYFDTLYFQAPLTEQIERMQKSADLVDEMARVTLLFMNTYTEMKRARKLIDFNDFEHLALSILTAENEQGRKEASSHYRTQFTEVMIDEYQDINPTQEEILYWLTKSSNETGNRFMVGDVKQSIYAFRLANPKLFIAKYEQYKDGVEGERIILAENFRSRKEILDFTNLLFIQLMNKEVGQMAYDEAAELQLGLTSFQGESSYETEILIFEQKENEDTAESNDSEEDEPLTSDFSINSKTEGELLMVGEKIKGLIKDGFEIYDKKTKSMRALTFKDIVLLTPTKMNNLVIQELFHSLHIPVTVSETQNYFRTTEISIMMSLLKVIDNPHQDIPVAAVLRSPIVGLNEQELALLRLANRTSDYYQAVIDFHTQQMSNSSPTKMETRVYQQIDAFLKQLDVWREKARRSHLVDLIWSIYQETGYLDYVGGMSAGKQRKANLHALYERAYRYEQTTFKGLFQFIRFIEKMQEKDKDLAEPAALSEGEDAVRVMTIHGSKGLEFPVVFVLDLSRKLSAQDLAKPYVFDQTYGVGIVYKDLEERVTYTTFPELLLKQEKKNQLRSEELRVLYVALTRAEQKLFLVGSYKNEQAAWEKWEKVAKHEEVVLPSQLRLNAESMMDWIGMSLIRHPNSQFSGFESAPIPELTNRKVPFSIHFHSKEDILKKVSDLEKKEEFDWYGTFKDTLNNTRADAELSVNAYKAIEQMSKQYPHQTATQTTSYQSVSEIKRLFEEPQDGRQSVIDIETPRNQFRYVEEELARPSFVSDLSVPTGAEIGQATHLVLQSMDLSSPPTETSIRQEIQEMETKGIFTASLAKKVSVENILAFFETEFGEFILNHAESLHREVPFALLMEAKDLYPDMNENGEDNILVHGIIDGYIEEADGLVLFDYKTDKVERFGEHAQTEMKRKYSGQLRLYKQALASILNKEVKAAYLILLDTNELVSVR